MAPAGWPLTNNHCAQLKEELITSDSAIKLGRPVLAGTRVTVDEVLDRLAAGASMEALTREWPLVTQEGVLAALRFAAEAVRGDNPIEGKPPLELHGVHPVEMAQNAGGEPQHAIAVRAYFPDAAAVAVRRMPQPPAAGRAWIPVLGEGAEPGDTPTDELRAMERVHPDGVFETVFIGASEPFYYQLEVTGEDGSTEQTNSPYGMPPYLKSDSLPSLSGAQGIGAGAAIPAAYPCRLHEFLGAHVVTHMGIAGVAFAVWAPNAQCVSVIGDFNQWNDRFHPMRRVDSSGVWELFLPGLGAGALYKYRITPAMDGPMLDKADPYAFAAQVRPDSASVVFDLGRYGWKDSAWLASRPGRQALDRPIAIYEVHLGSWRRVPCENGDGEGRWMTYRELADQLVPYVKGLGYTHIEPMPVSEHPFDGSWGYQVTGFFAPTSRYGSPDDFRYFVDKAHEAGLGIILDWVPGHFPKDAHGLALFDGSHLYEHPDPRRSENLEWGTLSFNLARQEVAAFLLSNAVFWLEQYHIDGLRVDAVSSMIYLDYSRQHWVPNELGGRENLEAAAFLQRLNAVVHEGHPGVLMIAEESTAWPRVTGREVPDSLGFDLKWNLGWMHDTLGYAQRDPLFRKHHHNDLTFSLVYAFNENFLLPLSHDEVVHGKRSLLSKMPGDPEQQFANLRTLYGYMYAHPGKKLHFMGSEFGPLREWSEGTELDWGLLAQAPHRQLIAYVRDLNRLYTGTPALHQVDFGWDGFQWIDCNDSDRSIVSFLRRGRDPGASVMVVANFTPVLRTGYLLGVPASGDYAELLNSDASEYGGTGVRNVGPLHAQALEAGSQAFSISVSLPPLGIAIFARVTGPAEVPPAGAQARVS